MYIVYASKDNSKGVRVSDNSHCPVSPDCYLCDLEKCRYYTGDCEFRFEVHTPEQLERIRRRMNINKILEEKNEKQVQN